MKLKKTLIALLMMSMLIGLLVSEQTAAAKEQSLENSSMEADQTITEETEEIDEIDETEEIEEIEETAENKEEDVEKKSKAVKKSDKAEKTNKVKADKAEKNRKKDKKASYTQNELKLMSCIIYCEANNQPYAGKLAVGIVVMNRKASSSFPDTVKGVIYSPYQFTPARNGSLSAAMARYDRGQFTSSDEKQCIKAAKEALSGEKKVTYAGKTTNMKNYHFFSGYVSGARLKIGGHMFK